MSLQWTAVATFLYAEVFFVLLLCIPFISPKRSVHGRQSKNSTLKILRHEEKVLM